MLSLFGPIPMSSDIADLVSALEAALAWIDAVPSDVPLPCMPGFDRDDVNILLYRIKK